MRKRIASENGRLIVEQYPSKTQFLEEAARDDCSSWFMLHVAICHDTLDTLELYNLLKFDFTEHRLSKRYRKKLIEKESKEGKFSFSLIDGTLPDLNSKREGDWSKPEESLHWYSPQIELSLSEADKFHFNIWVDWCNNMLKVQSKHAKTVEGKEVVYNPYEGLRFLVRGEFHD